MAAGNLRRRQFHETSREGIETEFQNAAVCQEHRVEMDGKGVADRIVTPGFHTPVTILSYIARFNACKPSSITYKN